MSLGKTMEAAAHGSFPVADGLVELVPRPHGVHAAIVAFTNHALVAANMSAEWLAGELDPDDIGCTTSPQFVRAMEGHLGHRADNLDVLLAASAASVTQQWVNVEAAQVGHARDERARRFRDDVSAYFTDDGDGLIVIGRGLDGRLEASIEVSSSKRSQGLGTQLAATARALVPKGEVLFAQVAPGNVQSLRAFMAAGFVPIAAEILFLEDRLNTDK